MPGVSVAYTFARAQCYDEQQEAEQPDYVEERPCNGGCEQSCVPIVHAIDAPKHNE